MEKIITNKEITKLGTKNDIINIIKRTGWTIYNIADILNIWDKESDFCFILPTKNHSIKEEYKLTITIKKLLLRLSKIKNMKPSKITRLVIAYQKDKFGKVKYKNLIYQLRLRFIFNMVQKGKTIEQIYLVIKTMRFKTVHMLLKTYFDIPKVSHKLFKKYIELEKKKFYKVIPNDENDEFKKWNSKTAYDNYSLVVNTNYWNKSDINDVFNKKLNNIKIGTYELIGFDMGFDWKIIKGKRSLKVYKKNLWNNETKWIKTIPFKIPREEKIAFINRCFK